MKPATGPTYPIVGAIVRKPGAAPSFELERRSMSPLPPGAKSRGFGLPPAAISSVARSLDQKRERPVTLADVAQQDKSLAGIATPAFGGPRMPDEVELHLDAAGQRVVVESFTDAGSCRDHWVGIARRTPIGTSGEARPELASFWIAGTTPIYERALDAWSRGDKLGSLRFFAASLSWSTPMAGSVRTRAMQAANNPADLVKLEKLTLKPTEQLDLRDEPHPKGRVLSTYRTNPVANPVGNGDCLRLARVGAKDGFPRLGPGSWELVLAPQGMIGFTAREPNKAVAPTPSAARPP